MSKKVVIIGASGHAKVVADIVMLNGDFVIGFLDDAQSLQGTKICDIPVLGTISEYSKYDDCWFIIAIGDPYVRKSISQSLKVNWYTAIHPNSIVSKLDTTIGEGTVIMANAVVNPSAKIGKHCIINTSSVIEHDDVLEDYVHISPKAELSGIVSVGECTHIGAGVSTKQQISIAPNCIVGVGAAVVDDIKETGIYVGVPARKIK